MAPAFKYYWEDFPVGRVREVGGITVSREDIVAFARQFDPQPFHLDEGAARLSMFGGLIASGWHTMAMWMRYAILSRQREAAERGVEGPGGVSPGFEDVRWHRPVRPGDTLTFTMETVGKRDLASRPALGLVLSRNEARGPDGTLYMSFTGKGLVPRKPNGG